jgi:lipid-A-disaccharide synthase
MTPRPDPGRPLLVVAGEASGDLHAARLLSRLRELVPDAAPFGMGGAEMVAAGLDRVADSAEVSVVGLTEVLKVLPRARELFARLLAEVDRRRPELAVLVDFPEFNLRLARELAGRGVPVVYYISPQVWAWRRGRVKQIAETVDQMLVLFPFEADFYAGHGVEVTHVGHPLVDEVPELPQVWDAALADPAAPRPGRDRPYEIALLPGSRPSEVEALLPAMLESVRLLADELPVFVRLVKAPGLPPGLVEEAVALSGLPVRVSDRDRFHAIADSHLALCASGTATLEVAMLGTPMLVLYRLTGLTYLAARLLVRLPHISLVNLVLGRGVVPELVQRRAEPPRVAREAAALLGDPERVRAMRAGLAEVRGRLGEGGGSGRAAREVAARLLGRRPEVDETPPGAPRPVTAGAGHGGVP